MPECPLGVDPDTCRKQFSDLHVKVALLPSEILNSARGAFVSKEEYAHMILDMAERKKNEVILIKRIDAIERRIYAALVVLGVAVVVGKLAVRYIAGQ